MDVANPLIEYVHSGRMMSLDEISAIIAAVRKADTADELQALFDMQHSRVREAEQLWRDCNPGNELVMPDLGQLVQWLMDDRLRYKADAERLAEALRTVRTNRCGYAVTKDNPYPQAISDLWNEIQRMDKIARAALAAHERGEG